MKKLPPPDDIDALLKDKMSEIEALVAAIASEAADCDLRLAELLEGEPETVRIAIIKKLREMLKVRAEEKERELDKFLERERRAQVERERNVFRQWLQWMMSEETIRKMRDAFLSNSVLERYVRGIGHQMSGKGMNNIQLGDKRDLGELGTNVPDVRGKGREKGQGRE